MIRNGLIVAGLIACCVSGAGCCAELKLSRSCRPTGELDVWLNAPAALPGNVVDQGLPPPEPCRPTPAPASAATDVESCPTPRRMGTLCESIRGRWRAWSEAPVAPPLAPHPRFHPVPTRPTFAPYGALPLAAPAPPAEQVGSWRGVPVRADAVGFSPSLAETELAALPPLPSAPLPATQLPTTQRPATPALLPFYETPSPPVGQLPRPLR